MHQLICFRFSMNEIILCIFTLVLLNQLNRSAGYHFYLTSHPNMIEYLQNMAPQKTKHGIHPRENIYCKMLKESRIFKAADTEAPIFQLLGTDWETLLNFTDPSLIVEENSSVEKLNVDMEREIDKLGNDDHKCNSQLLCFKSPTYEYYLVFSSHFNCRHYDKFLLVRHVESNESAILGLVQTHTKGTHWNARKDDVEAGSFLEKRYAWIIESRPEDLPESQQFIGKETFCSMNKYHVLNYCSRVLNWFWDWAEGLPDVSDPSVVNSVEVNIRFIDGKLNLPTQPQKFEDTVFLPCTIKHQGGYTSQFHLTPAGGLFMAKNTDSNNYTLLAYITPVKFFKKKVDSKSENKEQN